MAAHRHRADDPEAPVPLVGVLGPAAGLLVLLLLVALVLSPGSFRVSVAEEPPPVAAADADVVPSAPPARVAAPPPSEPAVEAPAVGEQVLTALDGLLDLRDAAVAAGVEADWRAAVGDGLADDGGFSVLQALPVSEFESSYVDDTLAPLDAAGDPVPPGEDASTSTTWQARVDTTYELAGAVAVTRTDTVTLAPVEDGAWQVESWTPYPELGEVGTEPPWELGPVTATVGERAVVLAWVDPDVAGGPDEAREWGAQVSGWADAGAVTVDSYLGTGWPRTTMVLAPATAEQYAALVPGPRPLVDDVFAAVTTDVATPDGPGDVVVLNPTARPQLVDDTWQVTVTHELTHVASGARYGDGQEIWLAEGLADLVGWSRVVPGTVQRDVVAARLLDRVASGTVVVDELPEADAFTDPDPDVVGDAYEAAWLAALLLEDEIGTEGLLQVYEAASEGDAPARERVDAALLAATGEGREAFQARWAAYVRALADA